MTRVVERLIYPEKTYTSLYTLPKEYSIPRECFSLKYGHHFWIYLNDEEPQRGDVCLCGAEKLGDDIDGEDISNH